MSSKPSAGKRGGPTLDLHGRTRDEVPALVDAFLVRCSNQNISSARIMPGKGTGALSNEVKKYLKLGGYHFNFERNARGESNEGVLIVYFD